MKLLIIQLARLGDILQCAPAINAFKRVNPDAQVDMLVRPSFQSAAFMLDCVSCIHSMPSADWINEALSEKLDDVFEKMDAFVENIKRQNYDAIINLSFSPASSYLTQLLTEEGILVKGYSRYSDGNFWPVDDMAAYFHAQVGVDKPNRFHLIDIFASMLDVDIIDADWRLKGSTENTAMQSKRKIVFHVGASNPNKSLSRQSVANIVNALISQNIEVVLIGEKTPDFESELDELEQIQSELLVDLRGKTQFYELINIYRSSQLGIGADSGPMNVASVIGIPYLCVSHQSVNEWETGPKSPGSRIVKYSVVDDTLASRVAQIAIDMINNYPPSVDVVYVSDSREYLARKSKTQSFEWSLIRAIYLKDDLPVMPSRRMYATAKKLHEINELAIEQIFALQRLPTDKLAQGLLERCDQIIDALKKMEPQLRPLFNWFETEKIRIAPSSLNVIIERTLKLHQQLQMILQVWIDANQIFDEELVYDNQNME